MKLAMYVYLATIEEHGLNAAHELAQTHHPKVVLRKAEKAADKGYVEYGTSPWYTWLTPKGREFLARERPC